MKRELFTKIPISYNRLAKFVRLGKTTEAIARYFRVSERTIYRRVAEWGLKGIRPKGKRPIKVKKPARIKRRLEKKAKRKIRKWIPVIEYIDELDKEYGFVNIEYPPYKYIHKETLVCSNEERSPRDKKGFTTTGIYFIITYDDLYFLFTTSARYSFEPVGFQEIYNWIKNSAWEMLEEQYRDSPYTIVDIVAYTFYRTE